MMRCFVSKICRAFSQNNYKGKWLEICISKVLRNVEEIMRKKYSFITGHKVTDFDVKIESEGQRALVQYSFGYL